MIKVELLVSQDLYIQLGFYPKMTLLLSETGTIKFVPTIQEDLINSLHCNTTNCADKEGSENYNQIDEKASSLPSISLKTEKKESCCKFDYSPNSCSVKSSSERLSEKTNSSEDEEIDESDCDDEESDLDNSAHTDSVDVGFTNFNKTQVLPCTVNKKKLPIKHLKSRKNYICEGCKIPFKSHSGYYRHEFKCPSRKKAVSNPIKSFKSELSKHQVNSILLESKIPQKEVNSSDNAVMNEDFLKFEKEGSEPCWASATRAAPGTVDAPAYFFVKKS